jgi:hypothetical protein
VEHVNLNDCTDATQLGLIHRYLELNAKMLLQGHPKLKKFLDSISKRIEALGEGGEVANLIQDEESLSEKEREEVLTSQTSKLQSFYDDEILGTLIDVIQDNDDEYYLEL